MKRYLTIIIGCLLSFSVFAQEHIQFNGATFGVSVDQFFNNLNGHSSKLESSYYGRNSNHNLYNENKCNIRLNSELWECHIFSSRTSNTVFRTISVYHYTDLKNGLMLLVKTLEEKYGGHKEEKQEDLGEIQTGIATYKREMLALYYYVTKNNKIIGEIRISAAPNDKDAKWGYVELSYTDYAARELSVREYNSIMNSVL